ncbi:hypothetical protein [Brasilonema sp. UFV-L1]|uniref:hypothetical protein n=1 Tax=Brasilonema sp. UFV-L1 TaxID=2234130 RepID=UPI00145DB417|nr:hypothetical protein [Brasilonema sp. UFV-L1]NMG06135.1 hypothetical protein [Brasilonema sp. UFV-L1]
MGRWTPLILMAGGLAILLGTLLGISFPMGGQNTAQAPAPTTSAPQKDKESKVLPANIDVNSTSAGNAPTNGGKNNIAQTNQKSESNNDQRQDDTGGATNNQPTDNQPSGNNQSPSDTKSDANQSDEPIRALW